MTILFLTSSLINLIERDSPKQKLNFYLTTTKIKYHENHNSIACHYLFCN